MKHTQEQLNYAFEVAKECYNQIRILTPVNVYFSWGVSKVQYSIFKSKPALVLTVNGFLHKGRLLVCYNEGTDAYDLYCIDSDKQIVNEREEVYFDELPDAIDRLVERGVFTSDEEYKAQVEASLV